MTDEPKLTVGSIRDFIKQELAGQKTEDPKPIEDTKSESPVDLEDSVQRALASLKRREERVSRDKKIDEFLATDQKNRESATPDPQKPPVESRWIEKFMKWE